MGVRSVLDVGCAAGHFLDGARALGMETVGIEPGPAGADASGKGHRVLRTWLREADLGGRKFDAVSLWEVIEHVPEPLELIHEAARHLRPGGVLALSTPSMSGLPALLLGKRFPMVTPPEHLTLLSREGLKRLLARASLSIEEERSFSNLESEQIRSGLSRYVLGRSRPARLLGASVALPMVVFAKLMDGAMLGSELEVYARRGAHGGR